MKVLIFGLLSVFVSASSAAGLYYIEGINEYIVLTDSDSEGNIYASTYVDDGSKNKLYQIDSERKIQWTVDLPDGIPKALRINNQNDVFVVIQPYYPTDSKSIISRIQSGSSTVEELERVDFQLDFMDDEGYWFYSVKKDGLRMIRPNESVSVQIAGSENFELQGEAVMFNDKQGNVYLAGCLNEGIECSGVHQIILILAEEKNKEFPKAQIIDNILEDPENEEITQMLAFGGNDIIISTYNSKPNMRIGKIWQMNNNTLKLLLSGKGTYFGKVAKDRIIYQIGSSPEDNCRFCNYLYLNENYEFILMPNLQNLDPLICSNAQFESDEEGNLFLSSKFQMDTSYVEVLHYRESKTVGVNFTENVGPFSSMALDRKGNLWLVNVLEPVMYVEKGTSVGVKMFDPQSLTLSQLKRNKGNNDIIVTTTGGHLYTIVID